MYLNPLKLKYGMTDSSKNQVLVFKDEKALQKSEVSIFFWIEYMKKNDYWYLKAKLQENFVSAFCKSKIYKIETAKRWLGEISQIKEVVINAKTKSHYQCELTIQKRYI